MMSRPFVLAESTWGIVSSHTYEVAILPWGATEAHNRHLPYATDNLQAERVSIQAAEIAWKTGARVLVLPTVPWGVNTGQREIPFCLNLNPTSQLVILRDLIETLEQHGVKKLVILNGHGGNDFRWIVRELQPETSIFLCCINWYTVVDPQPFFSAPGDHAGELETSMLQHLAPDLVLPLAEAGSGEARSFLVTGLREGWAWAPRHWVEVTDDTGVGDPAMATAEKGRRYFEAATEKIAGFLIELAAADLNHLYGEDVRGS
jgi:creatinine amidohydrolase